MNLEKETALCELVGTPQHVAKLHRRLKGNFSKLNWEDLLLLAGVLSKSFAHTLGVDLNAIRVDETIDLAEKDVRPIVRLSAAGNFQLEDKQIGKIVLATVCKVKNENPLQSSLQLDGFELPALASELIHNFMRQHGEKRLDGQVQFALEDGKIFTVSGKLGPKPVESISSDETKTIQGVVDGITYSSRELKLRCNGSKTMTLCKFHLTQLKMLCANLEAQHPANFKIGPSLDAQGKKFDVLLEIVPIEGRLLELVSRG